MERVHAGKYAAWELRLCHVKESDEARELRVVYLTSVGTDPSAFDAHYKSLKSGVIYVAIDDLQSFFRVDVDGQVGTRIRKVEYDAVNTEASTLRIVEKLNVEVNEHQFPLLEPRR